MQEFIVGKDDTSRKANMVNAIQMARVKDILQEMDRNVAGPIESGSGDQPSAGPLPPASAPADTGVGTAGSIVTGSGDQLPAGPLPPASAPRQHWRRQPEPTREFPRA